jgi:hypothetical protein
MPSFLKYGSTGRPPGKLHIRHSPKKITENLEFFHPPFDILFIEITNNNNNIICYYDNGGINNNNNINYIDNGGSGTDGTDSDTNDTNVVGHRSNQIAAASEWFANRFESNRCNYKYKFNNDGTSTTTTTSATATINYKTRAEGISNEGGEDAEAAARLSEWFANRFESNQCNYKYKFNIDGISTTTAATPAPATMAEGISNEGGEDTEASAVSEWFAVRFESNHINNALMNQIESNRYKYNNNNKSDTSSCTTTTTTTTIDYNTSTNTSTYDDNKEADTAHSIHRTDKIKWFESISNNNNNNKSISPSITNNTNTTNNDDATSHLSLIFKLLSLFLIIIKSFPPKEFKTAPKEKQQQQQQYHGKQRHQFHLEQQQKQNFKHEHHNVERMAASIALKLTLVAWDMWTYRNGF